MAAGNLVASPAGGRQARERRRAAATYVVLTIVAIAIGAPFFWMITTALKPPEEILVYPPRWLPSRIRWENFVEAWRAAPFARFYVNSVFVTVSTTVLEVLVGLLSAYAFARLQFPKREWLFVLVLATLMIPGQMTLVPNFVTLKQLGWINSYWALIIPPASNAFGTFLLRQHILSLPSELFDAARIDGAGHVAILWHLVIPLTRPILATLALLSFISHWNAYLWPLIVTNTADMRTLPIGLVYMRAQEGGNPWHLLMAGTLFVIAPILVLFLLTQKQLVAGIARGALKG